MHLPAGGSGRARNQDRAPGRRLRARLRCRRARRERQFVWLNRGKQSVVLDLAKTEDKAVLEAMLAKADVFVQNLKPGALGKLGFRVRASAQGLSAADLLLDLRLRRKRALRAAQGLRHADPGRVRRLASITGGPEAPARAGVSVVDIAAGMNAYEAILEALLTRGRPVRAPRSAISMFDAMAEWMSVPLFAARRRRHAQTHRARTHLDLALWRVQDPRGADVLISIQNDREWRILAENVMGESRARRRSEVRHQCRTRRSAAPKPTPGRGGLRLPRCRSR